MKFTELMHTLISQTPIKRAPWGGYWKYDPRTDDILMYTKDGRIVPVKNSENLLFTIANLFTNDWEIATNDNCDIEVK